MKAATTKKEARPTEKSSPFQFAKPKPGARKPASEVHVLGSRGICDTEDRGHATPRGRSPLEIVVDASEGFIPLWAKNTTLRWRFRERSMRGFANPTSAKNEIRKLLGESLLKWGDAAPVKFAEKSDAWDFEIVMRRGDDCDDSGCVLASAFFPDAGRHELTLYPKMFTQSRKEQIETLVHEIGHIFGLRHFFAKVSETAWPAEIFVTQKPFTNINYGALCELTADDMWDLKRLYASAWNGDLTHINGTPIRLVRPYHTMGIPVETMIAASRIQSTEGYDSGKRFNYQHLNAITGD
jgi:hypothetical protein